MCWCCIVPGRWWKPRLSLGNSSQTNPLRGGIERLIRPLMGGGRIPGGKIVSMKTRAVKNRVGLGVAAGGLMLAALQRLLGRMLRAERLLLRRDRRVNLDPPDALPTASLPC